MTKLRLAVALALSTLIVLPLCGPREPTPALAGTAPFLELEAVVAASRSALIGTVLEARGRIGSDGLIETEYRLAVDQRFVGEGGVSEVVTLPGGVLPDGRGLAIPGVPTLAVGEETVLFLSERDVRTGRCMTVGLEQGRYRIVTDREGRRVALGQGPTFVAGSDGAENHLGIVALPYQQLRARIEAAVQSRRQESR